MVDLRSSDPRVLGRNLGEAGFFEFQAIHGINTYSPGTAPVPKMTSWQVSPTTPDPARVLAKG
jgi:hypothetical protein